MPSGNSKTSAVLPRDWILVLALDPGTTRFKSAILEVTQSIDELGHIHIDKNPCQPIVPLSNFPGFERLNSNSVPTALVYDNNRSLSKWGHHAIIYQTDHRFDPRFFVSSWKLGLRTASQMRRDLEATADYLGLTPEDFIEDFFKAISLFILDDEDSPLLEHLGSKEALQKFKYIDVVIPLPPGWPRNEHRTFTSAATRGLDGGAGRGLGGNCQLRIFTVSETECVLNQWITEARNKEKVKVGDIILLLDLGGGTACISAFRCISSLAMSDKFRFEHIESHSLPAGSQIVTEAFTAHFQRRMRDAGIHPSNQTLFKVRKDFDLKKLSIGTEKVEGNWSVEVDGLKRLDRDGLGNGKMWFTGEQLLGYFKPSQDQILEKLSEVVGRIEEAQSVSKVYLANIKSEILMLMDLAAQFCVVAGEYGRNVIFKERLKTLNTVRGYSLDLSWPNYNGETVVRGACLARAEGEFRQSSGSLYSIAILTYIPWNTAKEEFPLAALQRYAGSDGLVSPVLQWGDPSVSDQTKDADSDQPRIRYFDSDEKLVFEDTIYISERHPGDCRYTYLKYKTSNPIDWSANEADLLERGIEGKAFTVPWDSQKTRVLQNDGSYSPISRKDLFIGRNKEERLLRYKYFVKFGQIDIKLYLKSFFTKGRSDMMAMSHKQIVIMDEPESTTLAQEYDHLPEFMETSESDGTLITSNDEDMSDCYDAMRTDSGPTVPTLQEQKQDDLQDAADQLMISKLRDVASCAINHATMGAISSTLDNAQEDVSISQTEPEEPLTDPAMQRADTCSPVASHSHPLPDPLKKPLRRPRTDTIVALRSPVVKSRKKSSPLILRPRKRRGIPPTILNGM